MPSLTGLYLRLPTVVQNLACTLEGYRIQLERYGGRFSEILDALEQRASWNQQQLEEFRNQRLDHFIQHYAQHAPHYKKVFQKCDVRAGDIRTIADLQQLPVLSKEEVRGAVHEFRPLGIHLEKRLLFHTSGSTGTALHFDTTRTSMQEQWAVWWRWRRSIGIDFGTWSAYFGGRAIASPSQRHPPFWRINYCARQVLFSAQHLSPGNMPGCIAELRRRRPLWLHGYPSLLTAVATYLLDTGNDLGYDVRWVTTGAENLLPNQVCLLQRAFHVRPRQVYGMAEAVANLSDCEQGRLHVDEDFSATEFLPTGDGITFRIVGTNFTNPAMPLLRYDTGDLATLGPHSCPCGRPGRTVERIDGRSDDFVILADGRRFGPVNHLFEDTLGIREAQVCQREPGNLLIRVIPSDRFSPSDEYQLLGEIRRRLGNGNHIRIEYVRQLPRSSGGKLRAVVFEPGQHAYATGKEDVLQETYSRLPVVLQNVACSFEGFRIRRQRYGDGFHRLLEEAERRTFWTKEKTQRYRAQRLKEFLRACVPATPYYQGRRGLPEELNEFPILTKREVKERLSEFTCTGIPGRQQVVVHTSGTTGAGLRFNSTREAQKEQWVVWWRYRRWHGIEMHTWCAYFGGRPVVPVRQIEPPFWRVNYTLNQIMFSAYHMNQRNLRCYVDELRRRRPPWIHGYPSLLALMARHLLDSGFDLGYQPGWITTGAENLLTYQAALIERAFGVRPRQHYGLAEAVANFSECELGCLHVDEDFSAVEFIPVKGQGICRVIGTNFTNPATPLVRYDTQDMATLAPSACPCGRSGRTIEQVDGRREDYVVLRNGTRLGRMDHIFKDLTNIREAQIYQKTAGEIVYRIVREREYGQQEEDQLIAETKLRIGDLATIRIEYVDSIERTATGKLRFVISEVPEGALTSIHSC